MLGLRTQEDEKFINFFAIVQEAAKKKNSVFFGDSGEGHDIVMPEFEGEDLYGWLIPKEKVDEFEKQFTAFNVSSKWDPFLIFANWYPDGENIKIIFENGKTQK